MNDVFTVDPDVGEITVEVLAGDARRARRVISQTLTAWQLPHLTRTAVVVGHELVANALRHGMPPAVLRLLRCDDGLIIEVGDGSTTPPRLAEIDNATSMSGRGMHIVARLALRWGVRPVPSGKIVWAELA